MNLSSKQTGWKEEFQTLLSTHKLKNGWYDPEGGVDNDKVIEKIAFLLLSERQKIAESVKEIRHRIRKEAAFALLSRENIFAVAEAALSDAISIITKGEQTWTTT